MWFILGIWGGFCIWVIGYCGWAAYRPVDGDPVLVLGLPHWVFWGVLTPWLCATLLSTGFALGIMKDHDLNRSDDENAESARSSESSKKA